MPVRVIDFSMQPTLLSRHLGSDMYTAPEALKQLIANALDSGCSRIEIEIQFNELDTAHTVIIRDDGSGISPNRMEQAFGAVGTHVAPDEAKREIIGTKGIGRFAVFSLAAESHWETVSPSETGRLRQRWMMVPNRLTIEIEQEAVGEAETGTRIEMKLHQRVDVTRLFSSPRNVKRALFNAFAGYLARFSSEVTLTVNGENVDLDDYVEDRMTEHITPRGELPEADLHHMVLGGHVEQAAPSVLVFATHGTTIKQEVLGDEGIPARRYLGLVDSPYLSDLTTTGKSDLAEFDTGFRALRDETVSRAKSFIAGHQGERAQAFLEKARKQEFYPYKNPPSSPVDAYRRQLYDGVLLTLEEGYSISGANLRQQELIFRLTRKLLQSEDLASVLTEVLGLKGEEVAKFADLLRRTSLSSMIAVADLLVDRLRFLEELRVLIYDSPAKHVRERSQLHKIVESHTWLFGEEYHLMGSDQRVDKIMAQFISEANSDDPDGQIDVAEPLRDIPDLWLAMFKRNEGANFYQHLIVEMKRPSVRINPSHVDRLHKYANSIVNNPAWEQRAGSHHFTFVLVSSEVSDAVKRMYQSDKELGFLSLPTLDHPTELWALRWSDYLDNRRAELSFLEGELKIIADHELLEYLRARVGDLLPAELTHEDAP